MRKFKDIKRDIIGSEILLPTFVLLISFVAIFIIISSASVEIMNIGDLLNEKADDGRYTEPSKFAAIAGIEYSTYSPTGGYNITIDNISDDYGIAEEFPFYDENMEFGTDANSIRVKIIMNNKWWDTEPWYYTLPDEVKEFKDYFYIYQDPTWQWWSREIAVISFEEVLEQRIHVDDNMSMVDFKTRHKHTLFIYVNDTAENFKLRLYEGNFTLAMGQNEFDTDNMQKGGLGIVFQLLTFQLPEVHPVINLIFAVPIWAAIGFLFLTVIGRFIPFLSAG